MEKNKKLEDRTKKLAKKIQNESISQNNKTLLLFTIKDNLYAIPTIQLDSVHRKHYARSLKGLTPPFWGIIMHQGLIYNVISLSKNNSLNKNKLNLIILKEGYYAMKFDQIIDIIHNKLVKIKKVDNPELIFFNRYFIYKDQSYYLLDIDLFNKYLKEIEI